MKVKDTPLDGVKIITPRVFKDHRGFFMESYNYENMKAAGIDYQFVQDNHSLTVEKGTIRGLHYQLNPEAQTKLVRVITGAVYDVAVDIRKGSPTYGKWTGVMLSDENHRMLLIPKGFAHGFCTLTENTHIQYKVDVYYSKPHDSGVLWNDPELGIDWPATDPVLSEKDAGQPLMRDAEINFHQTVQRSVIT
ncbi:dTDP-4-dehydrorhamnose 3,5-epimerase [Lentibacillus persicus]|uniref:dTDP-4-dehydrorhamnose 3,5-epimerase n=1 Tax=Lentibacillus persicus TaxID=640948 RepID=A0A1I1U7M9_9BACI|nr:dTDP-4-dehydrorhamnose 3,5-epimerase [Lentibacillus persicus]SFD66779.1 dTDP-4-dehydrorhamnose 3,5-epimerase [Lentibacillus persicus]